MLSMERDISIIIPSCNFNLLKTCVESIMRYTDFREVNAEFIIVANGLPQEAKQWLNELSPYFRYIWIDNRCGVCRSTNIAAFTVTSKFIGKMDDDNVILGWAVAPNWIKCLIEPFSDDKVGLVSPSIFGYKNDYIDKGDCIIGYLMVTRKELWDTIGGFDEVFDPGMGEDTDFSFKITDSGYKIVSPANHPAYYNEVTKRNESSFPIWHMSAWSYDNNLNNEIGKRNYAKLIERYGNVKPPNQVEKEE